jgi:hypothetical protein
MRNILIATMVISILVLIVVFFIFNEYELCIKEYFRMFILTFFISFMVLICFKRNIIKTYGLIKEDFATNEVFEDISDSQQINGILQTESAECLKIS